MASAIPLCLGFLTIFLHCVAAQQNNGSVSVGASLTAAPDARAWLSRSGEFAFGFQQLQGSDSFLLSIWYDKIPDKTIIWYPKDGPMVPRGSKAELIDRRGLILTDPQGREVWTSAPISDLAYGLMNDTGNFVLIGIDSTTIWESFGYPADTMLPTQILEKGGELNSKMSKANFSTGKFQLRLLQDGNLVLNTFDRFSGEASDFYYDSQTNDDFNSTNSGEQVIFDETGYLYILRRNGQRVPLTPRDAVPSGDYYHRASLDSDGVFTQYDYPKDSTNNSRWIVRWLVPKNICETGKACGLNNVCSLDGNRPKCECPQGFSLSEPRYSNGDCEPKFVPSCGAGYGEEQFDFTELNNTDWPGSDYKSINPSNEENCKTSCLKDCFCAVAIYRDSQCWKKQLPLSNGRKDPSKVVKAFLKFRKGDHPPGNSPVLPRENRNAKANRRVRIIVIPVVVGVTVLLGICLFVYRRMKQKGLSSIVLGKNIGNENEGEDWELPLFDFNTLANATNNFSHSCKLGEGGYGPVYKGMLDDGKEIAVKRHSRQSKQGLDEFKNEVQCIAKLQHRNLVKLLGCCIEEGERMLIYEYMPNLSLNNFIFDEDKGERKSLDWSNRYSIIIGIARGLLYLHQDSRLRIIHRDLKASNILLDKDMNPKISDFGLARSMEENITKGNTRRVMGTYGYMAPEYTIDGIYSIKSDVFSFGVLVLEIVSGKKNRGFHHADHDLNLLGHAWRLYQEGKQLELIDGTINGSYVQSQVNRAIHIGLLCVQKYPEVRPDMPMVVLMLASEFPLSEPVQPGFFTERRPQEGKSPSANHERSSYNHVSMTNIQPR